MKLRAIFSVSSLVLSSGAVFGHGALSFPDSRQWLCSGGATPNNGVWWNGHNGADVCSVDLHGEGINQVITDWSGVAQGAAAGWSNDPAYLNDPRSAHIAIMGGKDAPICSANLDKYRSLENDQWTIDQGGNRYPVKLEAGENQFTYAVTAPHKTYGKGYIDIYITRDDWQINKALTWNDLEEKPICHYVPNTNESALQSPGLGGFESFSCTIPESKAGQHIIYAVWQRDDSAEAFYSCSDVVVGSDIPTPPEDVAWQKVNGFSGESTLPSLDIKPEDTVTVDVCTVDAHSQCYTASYQPKSDNDAKLWQQKLAQQFNQSHDHKDVQIGVLSRDGKEIETNLPSGYSVYQTKTSPVNYQWRIEHHAVTPEPIESVWTPLAGKEGSAVFGAQSENSYKQNDQLNFRLWRSDVFDSGRLGGYEEAIEVPMVIDHLATWKSQYIAKLNDELQAFGVVIGVLQDDDTVKPVEGGINIVYINTEIEQSNHIEYTWLLENKGQVSPEPTPDLPEWSNAIGSYRIGSKVIRNGVTYTCTGHEGWCNQNAYDPAGIFGHGTWTKD
ncbi:lytic polysaccharide monooxygenase [Cysteiniphilum sp. JM-1]|uniref:lytic polysaccharide monooxygenase n=1 Tax=Cysteiniphilum sp. JM-1 TaxID=2610891 RepID=UPI001245F723|nr:lytic polysaccharide monooxygenase [Cysteiniphilum sp. JM-1]